MKKIFLVFILLCGMTIGASAQETFTATCSTGQKLEYTITSSHSVTLTKAYDGGQDSCVIPDAVQHNGVTYHVISIGKEAFYVCFSLTSINIPNSVISIGKEAFAQCDNLDTLLIAEKHPTFEVYKNGEEIRLVDKRTNKVVVHRPLDVLLFEPND